MGIRINGNDYPDATMEIVHKDTKRVLEVKAIEYETSAIEEMVRDRVRVLAACDPAPSLEPVFVHIDDDNPNLFHVEFTAPGEMVVPLEEWNEFKRHVRRMLRPSSRYWRRRAVIEYRRAKKRRR